MTATSFPASPAFVNWDITYACPLRCSHCYSESGRRASRQIPLDRMLRVADVLVSMRPRGVSISGGEPLLVSGLREVAERLVSGGIATGIYTSGFGLDEESGAWIGELFSSIHVSVDGADVATHDFIRGREGSFEQAMSALSVFDALAEKRLASSGTRVDFGIDFAAVQSNFHQIERMCSDIAPRFPRLRFLVLTAAAPSGLATREGYAELELLTEEQTATLRDSAFSARLKALAPAGVRVIAGDNFRHLVSPERIASGEAFTNVLQIEPDGQVRGIPTHEGTVGSILEEPVEVLWRRVEARHLDPFVARELSSVRNMKDWAAAARNIDRHFASHADLMRISRRAKYEGRLL
jgi:sulfatase maturation enzyme AslB (radical SAM superfamily)